MGNSACVNDDNIRLFVLGPTASFISYILTKSSGNPIKDNTKAQIFCLLHKLQTNSKGGDEIIFGFNHGNDYRDHEMTNSKPDGNEGRYNVIFL